MLELLSVHVEKPPAEAHWQMGRIEASYGSWRYSGTHRRPHADVRQRNHYALRDRQQLKNSRVRQCGSSAFQWTFGKNPKVPGSLLSVEGNLATHSGIDADEELRRRVQTRAHAETACVERDTSEALRRSILRAPRPHRENFEPGEKIAYWREAKYRRGKRIPSRCVVATVIGPHHGSDDPHNQNLHLRPQPRDPRHQGAVPRSSLH